MDYDKSFISASQIVISPIAEMEDKVQTAASSQAEHQLSASEGLEEGLVEVREASPASSVNDEVVTMQNHVARDTSLVRLDTSVIVHIDDELELLQQDGEDGSECLGDVWKMMPCFGILMD